MKRTIDSVLDLRTGKEVKADILFNQEIGNIWKVRLELEKAIREKDSAYLVCYGCFQKITIRGGKTDGHSMRNLYFSHYRDSDECPIKTNSRLTKMEILKYKYNGAKESYLHKETKRLIQKFLLLNQQTKKEISFIEPELIQKSKIDVSKWRRPDITSIFKDFKLVFEIQLSTTFLSVIADREIFYKENNNFILWIFKEFELETEKQRFMQRDIFYSNNRNAFVFNDEAIEKSILNNDLILLCYYQIPKITDKQLTYEWKEKFVSLRDLTFNETNYKVFYFDVESEEQKIDIELSQQLQEEAKSQADNEEKIKQEFEERRRKHREELIELENERIENKNKHIESLKQQEILFLEKKKQQLDEQNKEFKDVNRDFYIRLKDNYNSHTPFQKILSKPINELSDELSNLFLFGYKFSSSDKEFLNTEFNIELKKQTKLREKEILYYMLYPNFRQKFKLI